MTSDPAWWKDRQWSTEQREARLDGLRRDLGSNVELMEDPDYIRIGDRFGAYISCVSAERPDGYYVFVEAGPYLPVDDRPPVARTDMRYYRYLAQEADRRRRAEAEKAYNKATETNPVAKRSRLNVWMIEHIGDRAPDVEVFCSTPMSHGACWEKIGHVWHTPRGYYLAGQMVPFKEAIAAHLDTAARLVDMDNPIATMMANLELAEVDMLDRKDVDLIPSAVHLNGPQPGDGFPPWLVLGCPRHANAALDYSTMRDLVKRARKQNAGVAYNCSARLLGTLSPFASGQ